MKKLSHKELNSRKLSETILLSINGGSLYFVESDVREVEIIIARALKAERRKALREAANLGCNHGCKRNSCSHEENILSLLKETRSNG